MRISALSKIVGLSLVVGFAASMASSWYALRELKVNGPLYQKVIQGKDLVADILPPPAYIIEAYLQVVLMRQDPSFLDQGAQKLAELRKDYFERHAYWRKQDLSPELVSTFLKTAHTPAQEFWKIVEEQFLPAVRARDDARINASLKELTSLYVAHREGIDEVVKITNQMNLGVEAEATRMDATLTLFMLGAGISCILAVLLSIIGLSVRLVQPLLKMQTAMSELARGNLAIEIPALGRSDEIGAMASAVDTFRAAAAEKQKMDGDVSKRREEIDRERQMRERENVAADERQVQALRDMANRVEQAARKSVSVVVEKMDAMTKLMSGLAQTASNLRENSDGVASAAEQALASMRQTTRSTSELNAAIGTVVGKVQVAIAANAGAVSASQTANQRIQSLAEAVSRIENFTQIINDIARNTNLLALNAGVEAARTGEHGRGFAVIAQEVKALSEQTSNATARISELIQAILEAKDGTLAAVTEIGTAIERANTTAEDIGAALKEQVKSINGIAHSIVETEHAAADVATRIQRVAGETQSAGTRTQEADAICSTVAENILELQNDLIRSLRTASDYVDRRREDRIEVRATIQVVIGKRRKTVELLNVSSRGALLKGDLGAKGEAITLSIPDIADPVAGHIVRTDASSTSVKFDLPVAISDALLGRAVA